MRELPLGAYQSGWSRLTFPTKVRSHDETTAVPFGCGNEVSLVDNRARRFPCSGGVVEDLPGWDEVECYAPRFGEFGGQTYEQAVRPLAGFAYAMAAMLKTGIYDPSVTELTTADAMHRVELAIRGVAFTNVANAPTGPNNWGQELPFLQSWEAALWASHAAEAAWWLREELSLETKRAVAKMVEHDANALLNRTPSYWTDKNGAIIFPGDTKAEENAWNSHLLAVAQAMMPNHPNAPLWRRKASDFQVSAYSRLSDLTNTALVDGKPVKDWLNGYNTLDDGVVLNHNILHPDYLVCHALIYVSLIDVSSSVSSKWLRTVNERFQAGKTLSP